MFVIAIQAYSLSTAPPPAKKGKKMDSYPYARVTVGLCM
jgi:hypothetical protein